MPEGAVLIEDGDHPTAHTVYIPPGDNTALNLEFLGELFEVRATVASARCGAANANTM